MPTGQILISEIDAALVKPSTCALWWLGQSGFAIKFACGPVVYIDPFLSAHPKRLVPALLSPADIRHPALVLGSHDHTDHIDRAAWPGIAGASPQTRFVVPDLVRLRLGEDLRIPLSRLIGLDDGRSVECDGIRITGVAAAHEFLDQDPKSGRYPYLGYVVEAGGVTVFHSGDACIYEGLQAKLRKWKLDLMLLPINGRDAKRLARGCIGNMTYQEAADLAGSLAPGLAIPMHYDMFAANGEDPQLFLDYMRVKYPQVNTCLCQHGQKTIVTAAL